MFIYKSPGSINCGRIRLVHFNFNALLKKNSAAFHIVSIIMFGLWEICKSSGNYWNGCKCHFHFQVLLILFLIFYYLFFSPFKATSCLFSRGAAGCPSRLCCAVLHSSKQVQIVSWPSGKVLALFKSFLS